MKRGAETNMNNATHPDRDLIKRYIWKVLEEDEEIAVGEHLAECRTCARLARREARLYYLWENWQADTHGTLYWQNQIKEILSESRQKTASYYRKERLSKWLADWKSKVGGMLQFLSHKSGKMLNIITRFPEEIFLPQGKFQFAPATPVRGRDLEETNLKLVSDSQNPIQVLLNKKNDSLSIRIPKRDYEPPLVILMPRRGPARLALAEDVEGTNYYLITFMKLPPEGFCLLFEPLPGI